MTRFRVTDELRWTHEFDAGDGAGLAAGVRDAWDRYIVEHRHPKAPETHPALALGARLAEIRAWLDPRLARHDATPEKIHTWNAQAAYWRTVATRTLGGDTYASPLRLHVLGEVSGLWLDPTNTGRAPQVARKVDPEDAERLFKRSVAMVEHDRVICAFAGEVAELAVPRPRPRLVE